MLTPGQILATAACIDLTVQINFSLDLHALLSLSLWGNSELAETSPVPCYTAAENKLRSPNALGIWQEWRT